MDTRITLRKTFGHLITILTHKYWVFHYCRMLGITWRGVTHDLSKFHPVEFWESVRYWNGKSSPIPRCKEDKGYSIAWQHHKGHNTHHYEYWIDNLDRGGTPIKMPWNDLLELIADWLGAGRAYLGREFTLQGEVDWFENKIQNEHPKIHPATENMIRIMLERFEEHPEYLRWFRGSELKKLWKEEYNKM
jgi:hypothetical protein